MKKLIETVNNAASQLTVWSDSLDNLHSIMANNMRSKATELHNAASTARRRLPGWQGMPNGNGHYWVRYRAWDTSTNPKTLNAEFTTDLMLVDTDENTGECYLSSSMLGPTEMDMRDVGEDFEFCGPLKAPVMEEADHG